MIFIIIVIPHDEFNCHINSCSVVFYYCIAEPHYGAVESTETTTLLRMKTFKQPHPFVKMLLGIWPFGHSFKDLGYIGKTREVIKVLLYYTQKYNYSKMIVRLWIGQGKARQELGQL